MFIINTSGGAIVLKNSLLMASQEVRDRVVSCSIAPAALITKKICSDAYTYACEFDPIVMIAAKKNPEDAHTITWIKSTGTILPPEHSISSPFFKKSLELRLDDYTRTYGGIK